VTRKTNALQLVEGGSRTEVKFEPDRDDRKQPSALWHLVLPEHVPVMAVSGHAGLVTVGIQSRPEERGSPGAEKVIARSGPAIWASALPFSTRRSLLPQLRTRSEAHRGRRLLSKTMLARQALSSSRQFSSRASKICEPRSLGRLTRRRFLTAPLAFPHRRHWQRSPGQSTTDRNGHGM